MKYILTGLEDRIFPGLQCLSNLPLPLCIALLPPCCLSGVVNASTFLEHQGLSPLQSFIHDAHFPCLEGDGIEQLWLILLVSDYLQGETVQTSPTRQHSKRFVAVRPRLCFFYKFTYYPAYFNVFPTASLWQFGAQGQNVLFKFCIAVFRKALGCTS